MSLSPKVVDHLFDRLITTWGRDFMSQWEGVEPLAVKASWARELAGCAQCLHVIAWALDHLPARPLNAIGFRDLCRLAPAKEVPCLPAPPADRERVAAELAKVRALLPSGGGVSPGAGRSVGWAQAVLARVQAGDRMVTPTAAAMAQAALERCGSAAVGVSAEV